MILGYEEALKHLSRALQIYRDMESTLEEAEVLCNMGLVLEAQGNLAEAKTAFQSALDLKPGYKEALEALSRLG